GPGASVADAMTTNIPTVNKSRCLEDAFRLLQEKSVPAVGVVDEAGRLVGLVTSETIGEMLMLHRAFAARGGLGPGGASSGRGGARRRLAARRAGGVASAGLGRRRALPLATLSVIGVTRKCVPCLTSSQFDAKLPRRIAPRILLAILPYPDRPPAHPDWTARYL